jgi:integrase
MRGYIGKRSEDSWRIAASGGFDASGRRIQVWRTIRGTRREALHALTALQAELDSGSYKGSGGLSLGAYLAQWHASVSTTSKRGRPLAPTTARRYRDAIKHVDERIGSVRLSKLSARHVESLRDDLLASGRLSPQSVGDILRVLGQALRRASALGLISRNVADPDLVDRPAGDTRPFLVIDAALAQRVLKAVENTEWDAAVHLALGCTLRREEVLALRWEDIDMENHRITVARALTYADGALHVGAPKSRAGRRTIDAPRIVIDALRRQRARQNARRLEIGEAWKDMDLVVDGGQGCYWMPPSFSKGWARFALRHDFPNLTFHGLRHGAATLLLAAGVPDAVTAKMMGHGDTRVLRRYQEIVPELQREAAARMDVLLREATDRSSV